MKTLGEAALALLALIGACSRAGLDDLQDMDSHGIDAGAGAQGGAAFGGVGGSSGGSGSGGFGAAGSGGSNVVPDATAGVGGVAASGGSNAGGTAGVDAAVTPGQVSCGSTLCVIGESMCCDNYDAEPACLMPGTDCSGGASVLCDGGEDCAVDEVCCASLSTKGSPRYLHVECKKACNAKNERMVCSDTYIATVGSGGVDAGTGGASGLCAPPLCPNGVKPCGLSCLAPCPTGFQCEAGCCSRTRYCPQGTTCSVSDVDPAYRECR